MAEPKMIGSIIEKLRANRRLVLLVSAAGIALLLGLSVLCLCMTFTLTDAGFIRTDSVKLELQEKRMDSLSGLERCKGLTFLDVRGNRISVEEYERFSALMPECEILWSVPVGEYNYDSTLTGLEVPDMGITDVYALRYMTALETLDLSRNDIAPEAIRELQALLPGCDISWTVRIGDYHYDSACTEIVLADVDAGELDKLSLLTGLEHVDATACAAYSKLAQIAASGITYQLDWVIRVGGVEYPSDTRSIVLADVPGGELERLRYFPGLTDVDATACTAYDELYAVIEQMPECSFKWQIPLTESLTVSSEKTTLNLTGAVINDYERFRKMLGYLPALTGVRMDDCSLTNEQLDELRSTYPEKNIVWLLRFGTWVVPTDAQVFSCLNHAVNNSRLSQEELGVLRYCTDLRCIDLGHSDITDLSFLSGLTKLQAIILTDNPNLSDLSPLAGLTELDFIEIMSANISDLSPLAGLNKLTFINLGNNPISDLSPLYGLEDLKYCIVNMCGDLDKEDYKALLEKVPDCMIAPYHTLASFCAFREKNYKVYKDVFTHWDRVEYFNSWQDYRRR